MAWKNNPQIRDLESYAKKHGFKAVVVVCFSGDSKFTVNSYGLDKKLCDAAGKINKRLYTELKTGFIKVPDELRG